MSIYSALRAGVSGLNANSSAIAVIADNIANVNTTAYKRGTSDFSALVNGQAQETSYSAGGVISTTRRLVTLQGSLEQTRSATDLAISGDGFFIVTDDPTAVGATGGVFTRNGAFTLDQNGLMVNSQGYYLLGSPIQNGTALAPSSIAALQPIDLSDVGSRAVASSSLSLNANLRSSTTPQPGWVPATTGGALSGNAELERTVEVYDSLGQVNTLTFRFVKTDANENLWGLDVYWRDTRGAAPVDRFIQSGAIQFTPQGQLVTAPGSTTPAVTVAGAAPFAPNITIPWSAAPFQTGANDQTLSVDLTGITQFATTSALNSATVDGFPPGTLVGATVNQDGVLTAQFSNGRSEELYQIPIATFLNPDGLLAERGGAFRQTIESGLVTINSAGAGGAGAVQSNALEASNVDLGSEFTTMITTQRAYSASSRVITTADEMLEELLQVVR